MIPDDDVRQMLSEASSLLDSNNTNKVLANQLYRGSNGPFNWENQHPGGCKRHMTVFNKYNVIPKFCFNCYKVVIEPRTVMELFKLVIVFLKHDLPNDNVRKCLAEGRENVPGTYKGMIYCLGIDEGKAILQIYNDLLAQEISKNIPIALKRGCSEYALSYPEYAAAEQDMKYREEWQKHEDIADENMTFNRKINTNATHNHDGYSLRDAEAMLAWLRYAATIGDLSYLDITGSTLSPYQNLKRPTSFQPPDED